MENTLREYLSCTSQKVGYCDFYLHKDCPGTCGFAERIKKGITHQAKTGLERFTERYGENWRMVAFCGSTGLSQVFENNLRKER